MPVIVNTPIARSQEGTEHSLPSICLPIMMLTFATAKSDNRSQPWKKFMAKAGESTRDSDFITVRSVGGANTEQAYNTAQIG